MYILDIYMSIQRQEQFVPVQVGNFLLLFCFYLNLPIITFFKKKY